MLAPTADAAGSGSTAATGATGLSGPASPTTTGVSSTSVNGATVPSPTTTSASSTSASAPAPSSTGSGGSGGASLAGNGAIAANPTVSSSADGFSLQSHASGLTAHRLTFTGDAPVSDAGDKIELQRELAGAPDVTAWINTAQATIAVSGSFTVGWLAGQSGRFEVRAILAGQALAQPVVEPVTTATTATTATPPTTATTGATGVAAVPSANTSTTDTTTPAASAASGSSPPTVTVTVFKSDVATYYGAGLYGRHTACGEVLRKTTMGVANKTLRCGTEVNIYYNDREITVPVIDRGPYAKGVNWDLTTAAAGAIGMLRIGRATVGTLTNGALTVGSGI